MKIETFKVEQWMNEFEDFCTYNLAETCIDSLTLKELLTLCEKDESIINDLGKIRLTYGHIYGSHDLLEGIAGLYKDLTPEMILPTHGAIGANNLTITTLIEKGDEIISVMPTYQQHYSIPESIGATVKILQLRKENDYLPDIDELKLLVSSKTKMITVNSPNNPTGSLIPINLMQEIVEVAKSANAYLLNDEVYRGLSEDGSYMPSIVDIYDKGISVSSMSKIFSLAGLRMGWLASKCPELIKLAAERRDYDTISCGVLDDYFASLALANKEAIFNRNHKILTTNREILDNWVKNEKKVSYLRPVAGTTALVYYNSNISSQELCRDLLKKKGVMFTPGECFEMEGSVRIGYAFDSKLLEKGLNLFSEYLSELD